MNGALCCKLQVARKELALLPRPEPKEGSRFHMPVPHHELVDGIEKALSSWGFSLKSEKYGLAGTDGARLFGVIEVVPSTETELGRDLQAFIEEEQGFIIGFRSGNDQSVRIKLVAGFSVFVCENLILSGDAIVLSKKHTCGLDLQRELNDAISRYVVSTKELSDLTGRARGIELGDDEAKLLIYDAIRENVVAPSALPKVHRNFFEPEPQWTDITTHPRSLWALHNSFTRELRDAAPTRLFSGTMTLGRMLRERADLN